MADQQWHYYLKAHHQSLPNQSHANVAVDMLKPDKAFSFKGKDYGQYTPAYFGAYNQPDKRLSCCKANCNKSK